MRKVAILASVLLVDCSTAPAEPPVHGVTPGHVCKVDGTGWLIGRRGTGETGAAILRTSKAAVLRWAPPGVILTMDYRQDRVTVYLDRNRKITQIRCG